MARKKQEKINGSAPAEKLKLKRGFKRCVRCSELLFIHKYKCDSCGDIQPIKTHKVELINNLNKIDPKSFKSIRSLLELNGFNSLTSECSTTIFTSSIYKPCEQLWKEKEMNFSFKQENVNNLKYTFHHHPITCVSNLLNDIVYVESLEKQPIISQSQKITIKAFGLTNCHQIGCVYKGKSLLHYLSNQNHLYMVHIPYHIISMQSINNRLGMLIGDGSIIVVDFQISIFKNIKEDIYELSIKHHINPLLNDQFTTFTWLKKFFSVDNTKLVAGTLWGHICIYLFKSTTHSLIRVIYNSHFGYITSLAECPVSNQDCTLFASGGYDGQVCIWNLIQKQCLLKTFISAKNIFQLLWDPGAKTLLILKDEASDNTVFLLFFNIVRIQKTITFASEVQHRSLQTISNCHLISHDERSNEFALLDSRNNIIMLYTFQETRKCGQNRKQVKTDLFQRHSFQLQVNNHQLFIKQKEFALQNQKKQQKYYPITINTICHSYKYDKTIIYGSLAQGIFFQYTLNKNSLS